MNSKLGVAMDQIELEIKEYISTILSIEDSPKDFDDPIKLLHELGHKLGIHKSALDTMTRVENHIKISIKNEVPPNLEVITEEVINND